MIAGATRSHALAVLNASERSAEHGWHGAVPARIDLPTSLPSEVQDWIHSVSGTVTSVARFFGVRA